MKTVKVRVNHTCDNPNCGKDILKGSEAKVISRKFNRVGGDGAYFETYYFHTGCRVKFPEELF